MHEGILVQIKWLLLQPVDNSYSAPESIQIIDFDIESHVTRDEAHVNGFMIVFNSYLFPFT